MIVKYLVCTEDGDSVDGGIYATKHRANMEAQELADSTGDDHQVFEITVGPGETFEPYIEEEEEEEEETDEESEEEKTDDIPRL